MPSSPLWERMGAGASSRRGGKRPGSGEEAEDALALGMPSSLPPAYICIYCSDVVCRCRCLYCGERGHSTKLCARRAEHASAPLPQADDPLGALAAAASAAAAAAAPSERVYVHVRYTREVDEQRSHVAAKVIQSRWRGRAVRQRNRVCAPLRTPDEMARLSAYGVWGRRTRWRLLAYEPEPACVAAVTRIQSVERGAQCRRRRGELTRQASLAKLHCQVWQLKKWAAEPTERARPIEPAVAAGLSVGAGGDGGADAWVRLTLVVAPELLRRSEEERFATVIQKHYRGWLARKWHGMMDAMMMLPGQGGIDAAVEKYGFRIIGLLQELQHREAKLGSDHTDTADVRYNMGRLYQQHGDLDQALKSFNHALRAYTTNLGTAHPKSANLLYCLALIYKERAESGLEAEARKAFDKADSDGSGVVTMEELEPLLGKLFDDVDLSLCSGPQTVVALLLEVFEAEDSDGSGTLEFHEFSNVFRRCLLVIAQGYFEVRARSSQPPFPLLVCLLTSTSIFYGFH